jgi:hypothetical protein
MREPEEKLEHGFFVRIGGMGDPQRAKKKDRRNTDPSAYSGF